MSSRYTFAAEPTVDHWLEAALAEMSADIARLPCAAKVETVLLGGGYGRGEGGVLRRQGHPPRPYNDLDLFVIAKTADKTVANAIDEAFAALGKRWSQKLGIDVDFSRARTLRYIARRQQVMMWQELLRGHRVVYGNRNVFVRPEFSRTPVPPLAEGVRLLMNRFAGLLWARLRLEKRPFEAEDADFVARNINKAALACGEVLLMMCARYAYDTPERLKRLQTLDAPWFPHVCALRELYSQAVEFKKYPEFPTEPEALRARWDTVAVLAGNFFDAAKDKLAAACRPRGRNWIRFPLEYRKWGTSLRELGGAPAPFKSSVLTLLAIFRALMTKKEVLPQNERDLLWNLWQSIN